MAEGFFFWLALLLLGCLCAYLTRKVVRSKGNSSLVWPLLGFLFGPIALVAAIGLPDERLARYLFLIAEKNGVAEKDLDSVGDGFSWSELIRRKHPKKSTL